MFEACYAEEDDKLDIIMDADGSDDDEPTKSKYSTEEIREAKKRFWCNGRTIEVTWD